MTNQNHSLSFDERVDSILDEIQNLKSILNGRDKSFLPLVCENGDANYYSNEKEANLISEILMELKKNNLDISESTLQFYETFISFSIRYCLIACPENDSIFESLIKLANCLVKGADNESVFDILAKNILIESPKKCEDYNLSNLYEKLNSLYESSYDAKTFTTKLSNAVNYVMDNHNLSLYSQEECYENILFSLKRCARDLKRISHKHIRGY